MSWVLQIYPALTRRRALAVRLTLLRRAGADREPDAVGPLLRLHTGGTTEEILAAYAADHRQPWDRDPGER